MFPKNIKSNERKNTVIDWFKYLADKQKRKFTKFDIDEFYSSNSEGLLTKLINNVK